MTPTREVAEDDPSQCLIFTVMGDSERPAQGCWSFVGYVGAQGGKTGQALNLGQNCFKKEIVLHEVLHALGNCKTHAILIFNRPGVPRAVLLTVLSINGETEDICKIYFNCPHA